MKDFKILFFAIMTLFCACSTTEEKFTEKAISFLSFQKVALEDNIKYYYYTIIRIRDTTGREHNLNPNIITKADSLLQLINVEIGKENPSSEIINRFLNDTIFTKYSYDKEHLFSYVDFNNDTLNKLQRQVAFLQIKKNIYYGFYAKYLGCMELGRPFLMSFPDSNQVLNIYCYADTSSRRKKFFINQITLNDKKVSPLIEIEHKNGFYKASLKTKTPGIYKWFGGYEITLMTGELDTVPASGQFVIGSDNQDKKL